MSTDNNTRASVVLAAYNGELYIGEQIDSILACLSDNDELIISDDGSADSTWQIAGAYKERDSRVQLLKNKSKKGISSNFENALSAVRGQYIFFADQDDIWINDKVNKVIDIFEKTKADMIIHNGYVVDGNLDRTGDDDIHTTNKASANPMRNYIKCTYSGCCMALKREFMLRILPFPENQHIFYDTWTGIIAGFIGKIHISDEILVLHRLHRGNMTPAKRRRLPVVIAQRICLMWLIIIKLIKVRLFTRS